MMTVQELRNKYFAYCEKNGHTIIPSSPLIPENDATTLFTGSGMQPLLPYLLGEEHPEGVRVADSQKCFRAEDIDEAGDNRHTTFFEMLGNWSFGDYFKQDQLEWFFSFLVDEAGLDPKNIYVTCFIGDRDNDLPQDTESANRWQELFTDRGIEAGVAEIGSEAQGYKKGMQSGERIFYYSADKNWWSRSGVPANMPPGEPGGPDSEVFYDFGTEHDLSYGDHCHPNCDCGRFIEIGNSVFMEYIKDADGTFSQLPKKNVDFGGGLERIVAASLGEADVFKIDVMQAVIKQLEELSGKSYDDVEAQFAMRIVTDHMRGAIFMLSDDILPSNKEQGYILRRLLRRAIFYANQLGITEGQLLDVVPSLIAKYDEAYPALLTKKEMILAEIAAEEKKFHNTLKKGLKELEKMIAVDGELSGENAFVLFTTYGFPLEMTLEIASERGLKIDHDVYRVEFEKHRELSRSASVGKFKGGLADASKETTALHTCTHLMLAALRKELGDHVHQAGSNITAERTRFDFSHHEKVERDILDRIEAYVNEAINQKSSVEIVKMNKQEAQDAGVEGSFWEKYPETVNVYQVVAEDGTVYSKELCGGPHVDNTGNIEGVFKIKKEQSSSAGIRRIKAVLER